MAGPPEIDADLQPTEADHDLSAGWEEAKGPLQALGCALGCLGCSSSAIALAAIVATTVALALLLL